MRHDQYRCPECRAPLTRSKSHGAWLRHFRSKRHQRAIEALKKAYGPKE